MTLSARIDDLNDDLRERGADPATRLHALFDELWAHQMETQPELASFLGEPGPTYRWTDLSLEAIDRRKADDETALAALEAFTDEDLAALGDVDRTSHRLAVYERAQRIAAAKYPEEVLAVTTMYGAHIDVPQVLSIMPLRTIGDLESVVARLNGISVLVDQAIGLLEEGRSTGVTIPRVVAEQLPAAPEMLASAPAEASPLLPDFSSATDSVDAADLADIRGEADEAFGAATSAFRRFAAYLRDTYVPACRETTAFSDLPDGADWYAALVKRETTTDLTPAEIHAIGLDEVARIRKEMDEVIASTDFAGDFTAFAEFLRTDDRFYFSTADELLAYYRDISKRADAELPGLFGLLPRLPYGVKAIPDHDAPTAPAAYYLPGSLETGRAGWFCANTFDLRARPRFEMEATCLHEGVPGHHLQIALAAELPGLPKFRAKSWSYTAYVEGWGLYAESLGDRMGFYTDPYNRFGQLASELLRAIRLVVDTGLHSLGWPRQQAIDYFAENSTTPMHEIATEVDRYLSIPGQALAYKVGERTISRLRDDAAAQLGERFDLRAFHDLVLGAGALPLHVLEERTAGWIAERAG